MKGLNGDNNWLRLQMVYTRKDLPVEKEEIAAKEKIT